MAESGVVVVCLPEINFNFTKLLLFLLFITFKVFTFWVLE